MNLPPPRFVACSVLMTMQFENRRVILCDPRYSHENLQVVQRKSGLVSNPFKFLRAKEEWSIYGKVPVAGVISQHDCPARFIFLSKLKAGRLSRQRSAHK